MKEVRCPYCGKKLAEHVEGLAIITCRCGQVVTIDRRVKETVG